MSTISLERPARQVNHPETIRSSAERPAGFVLAAVREGIKSRSERKNAVRQAEVDGFIKARDQAAAIVSPTIGVLAENFLLKKQKAEKNRTPVPSGLRASRITEDGRTISLQYHTPPKRATKSGRVIEPNPNYGSWSLTVFNGYEKLNSYSLSLSSYRQEELKISTIDEKGRAKPLDNHDLLTGGAICKDVEANFSWLAAGLPDRSLNIEAITGSEQALAA